MLFFYIYFEDVFGGFDIFSFTDPSGQSHNLVINIPWVYYVQKTAQSCSAGPVFYENCQLAVHGSLVHDLLTCKHLIMSHCSHCAETFSP